ncbi:hypothetical protein INT43_002317 [Umbelopsis isabellina]|uniref:WRKY domain-containing protein n=1 Tax=Mortierella isabellina TaxID=91625 RepID=A0A8H7Q3N1_MORIS|nr:hypothetical protein INT43_002317 [Umbelopsis isabellina]
MNDLARYPQSNARDSGVYPRPIHPPHQQPQQSASTPSPLAPPQHRPLEPTPSSQMRYSTTSQPVRNNPPPPNNNGNNNNPASYDLQEIIVQYQQQPELLKLILSSKVEEDKRRAEEAKLRAKEIDLLLQQQPTPPNEMDVEEVTVKGRSSSDYSYAHPRAVPIRARMQSNDSVGPVRRGSILNSLDDRRSSFASQSSRYSPPGVAGAGLQRHPLSPPYSNPEDRDEDGQDANSQKKQRKRREMQAITKIVETREFPYLDDYFWKNNGNTTHKSGRRSVYYKCSNSGKGCPVNKTVTCRENGEYLIKYRGQHLADCGRVQRIHDA